MNKLQKGSTAVTTILVLVLLAVAAIGAYMLMHKAPVPLETTVPVTQPDTDTTPVSTTTPPAETTEPALPPHATPDPVSKVYTDKTFGYSVTYSKAFTATTDKTGKVTLAVPNSGLAPFTIVKATGSADTSTGKWGKNVLLYSKSGWVTQLQDENGAVYTAATIPFAHTPAGLPIFNGGTRHGFGASVYVVALSQTKFLIISGPEGLTDANGYDYSTDATLQIAKSVIIIK